MPVYIATSQIYSLLLLTRTGQFAICSGFPVMIFTSVRLGCKRELFILILFTKTYTMKRVVLLILTIAFPAYLMAQNSAVDKLFNKYKGKEGITTVQIGPELFQVVQAMEVKDIEECDIPLDKISSVKILTIEDEEGYENVNFYDEIKNDLNVDDFKEVMTVNDGGETVRMWMKVNDKTLSEFLLIVGGDDNVLIYITGDFTMSDLEGMAESIGEDIDIDF